MDPTLLDSVASASLEAAVGVAARASSPAWKQLVHSLTPDPHVLHDNPAWKYVKLSKKQIASIEEYLSSPLSQGLLQILSYTIMAEPAEIYEYQANQLGNAFVNELSRREDDPDQTFLASLAQLWQVLKASIEIHIRPLMDTSYHAENLLLVHLLTSRRTPIPEPNATLKAPPSNKQTHGKIQRRQTKAKAKLSTAAVLPERTEITRDFDRATQVFLLAADVRESIRNLYGHIAMPHAREHYRISFEDLYVGRDLMAISDDELDSLSLTSFLSRSGATDTQRMPEAQMQDQRYVLIGNPGAGKSTFVRNLILSHSEAATTDNVRAPFIYELKNYPLASPKPFHELIAERLRAIEHIETTPSTLRDLFVLGYGTVVFDGLDEVTDLALRRQVIQAIDSFARRFPLTRLVVTSRPEGYSSARLNSLMFSAYRLPDFTESQVKEYVARWFKATTTYIDTDVAVSAQSFLRDSAMHAADLRTNPLMLSLLCMIYKYVGYIPENRPRVYEECAELLFERWDKIRHVQLDIGPEATGRYLVQELAHFFFTNQSTQGGAEEYILRNVLEQYLLRNVVADREIARTRARDFLDFCAGRAWVLTAVGTSSRGERVFGFTHRTFMEYFTACYIVRQYTAPNEFVNELRKFILEGSSDVVTQIAIQRYDETTADGLNNCLSLLLFGSISTSESIDWRYFSFVVRCLAYMTPSPRILNKIYRAITEVYPSSQSFTTLKSLLDISESYLSAFKHYCVNVADVRANGDSHLLRSQVGCYELLGHSEFAWDADVRRALEDKLMTELPTLVIDFPATVTDMAKRGRLDLYQYLSACGPDALLQIGRVGRDGSRWLGPLFYALDDACRRLELDEQVSGVLRRMFDTPETSLPMRLSSAKLLLKWLNGSQVVAHKLFVLSSDDNSGLAHLGLLATMCAIELRRPQLPRNLYSITRRIIDARTFKRLWNLRARHDELDQADLEKLIKLGLDSTWIEFVESWVRGKVSTIDDPMLDI